MIKKHQEMFYKAVGKALTAARQQRSMSIAQLAKDSGEQNKTIRSIESGNVCSLHHLVWMIEIFDLNINKVISNIEGNNEQERITDIDSLI